MVTARMEWNKFLGICSSAPKSLDPPISPAPATSLVCPLQMKEDAESKFLLRTISFSWESPKQPIFKRARQDFFSFDL